MFLMEIHTPFETSLEINTRIEIGSSFFAPHTCSSLCYVTVV